MTTAQCLRLSVLPLTCCRLARLTRSQDCSPLTHYECSELYVSDVAVNAAALHLAGLQQFPVPCARANQVLEAEMEFEGHVTWWSFVETQQKKLCWQAGPGWEISVMEPTSTL